MRRFSSVIILGIGVLLYSGSPARAQLGSMGEAVQKGATDAAKQELMKQAGVPTPSAPAATPGTPAVTPAADAGAANAPAGEPKAAPPAAEAPAAAPEAANAPAGEPKVAPGAAETPAAAPAGDAEKLMMDKAAEKAMEEGSKKMMPKLP